MTPKTYDTEKCLEQILESRLQEDLAPLPLPDNAAKRLPALQGYEAGWRAAMDIAKDRPDTHPEDRRSQIRDERLAELMEDAPQTGYGWLSNRPVYLKGTYEQYARRGYSNCVEAAARISWEHFLESHPEQTTRDMMERRLKALEDISLYGASNIFTMKGLTYIPKSAEGCSSQASRVKYDILME